MARDPSRNTLFHLVPLNQAARNTLLHPDNTRFVSPSAKNDNRGHPDLGLKEELYQMS
jgi:hypothetical protein